LAEHRDQLAELAGALVEALQRAERGGVDGIVVEAGPPGGDGLGGTLEHGLVEAADALVQLAAADAVLLQADLDAEGPGELLVAALARVDAAEGLRGRG